MIFIKGAYYNNPVEVGREEYEAVKLNQISQEDRDINKKVGGIISLKLGND